MPSPIVQLDQVSLEYRLYTRASHSLRDWLVAKARGRAYQTYRALWALKDVTLHLEPGERLGVLGPNGAGKTTLLRVIAGIFPPSRGTVACRGRVVPLLELGLGFNGDMTGEENVVLASVLLGRSRRAALANIDRIMDFAELRDFVDVPLKYYSSGMSARLAFSIAMETEPDILLLDEVFAVGDIHWIRQAEQRIHALLDKARVVIMVSHNPAFLKQLARRGLYLDHGRVMADGPIAEVVDAYEQQSAGGNGKILDNRAASGVGLTWRLDGTKLHVEAEQVPLLGESWIGLYDPGAHREDYLGYRRVTADNARISFQLDADLTRRYELRLYRWTPGGESLEAQRELAFDVQTSG